ncbi:hypothetical protein D6764_03775, partial [Candidatus Woesearchaeota archaeon]
MKIASRTKGQTADFPLFPQVKSRSLLFALTLSLMVFMAAVVTSESASSADLSLVSPASMDVLYSAPVNLLWDYSLSGNETLANFTVNVSTNISQDVIRFVTADTEASLSEQDIHLDSLGEGDSASVQWSVTAVFLSSGYADGTSSVENSSSQNASAQNSSASPLTDSRITVLSKS